MYDAIDAWSFRGRSNDELSTEVGQSGKGIFIHSLEGGPVAIVDIPIQ